MESEVSGTIFGIIGVNVPIDSGAVLWCIKAE